jgi:uncharacterized delta-60 repeat protein
MEKDKAHGVRTEVKVMKIKITNKISTLVLVLLALVIFGATILTAAPGDFDSAFGDRGTVFTLGDGMNRLFGASDIAIQPDGRIVAVGLGRVGAFYSFAVARYNADGSLDNSFGGTGIVITPIGNSSDYANSVAIQADGKIVVAGQSVDGSNQYFAIMRYNTNGTLDTSLGGTGKVTTSVGHARSSAYSVAIQTDGKIVVAGDSGDESTSNSVVLRFNSNGTPDTSFNGTGKVITPTSTAASVVIQTDGKIVVAGSSSPALRYDFTIFRYNPDGSPDNSFNGTGKAVTSFGNAASTASSAVIQTDGKIVAAGNGYNGLVPTDTDFAVVRYNTDGSPDNSLGGTGRIIIQLGILVGQVAIQTDGKIVASGYYFSVVRLNPNGSLDTTFGGTGIVFPPYGPFEAGAGATAIQADGKIVAAGSYDSDGFLLARFLSAPNTFDFDGDGRSDISVFRPSDRIWYIKFSAQGVYAPQFGLSTDKITPADYDGDGMTDIAVYRDGIWYWLKSSDSSFNARQFGTASDIPVPADYSGDGRAELAVYREGVWWTYNLANNQSQAIQFGISTDKPVPADYDGDGRADQAVYRNGEWHLNRSLLAYTDIQFGLATDKPVPADYDGDGKTDLAVYRDGSWHIMQSSDGMTQFQWGIASDIPVPADYDGDGRTDAAVYRDGIWYLRQSTSGISGQQFGLANDKPVPAAYLP